MKLLKTIQTLIEESENAHYEASLKTDNRFELKILEKRVEESHQLLETYANLFENSKKWS